MSFYVYSITIYVVNYTAMLALNMEFIRKKKSYVIKRLGFLLLVLTLAAGTLLAAASPVMADAPAPQTILLLSGYTTQTAGYTYNNPYYEADTYVSGSATETAGYTVVNPSAAPLSAGSYSGSWSAAQIVTDTASPWATIGGASWVSTTSANSGVENATEGDAWRLFRATFNVSNIAAVTAASIQIAADNAYEFYLNGTLIDSTANWDPTSTVYGTGPGPGGTMVPFEQAATHSLTLQSGVNTLMFVVRNWDNSGQANPSGIDYKVTLQYTITQQQLNPAVYSGAGNWTNAAAVTIQPGAWVQTAGGAQWVSTTADYSGTDNDYKGDAWRLFKDQFNIPVGATIDSAVIQVAADNAFEFYLNGTLIASTANWSPTATVFDNSPEPGGSMIPFEHIVTYTITPQPGVNTLMLVVRNWDNGNNSNPTGLLYAASITYDTATVPPTPPPTSLVTVGGTVYKVNKVQLLAPWLGVSLGSLLVLSLAVNGFFFRKRLHLPNR